MLKPHSLLSARLKPRVGLGLGITLLFFVPLAPAQATHEELPVTELPTATRLEVPKQELFNLGCTQLSIRDEEPQPVARIPHAPDTNTEGPYVDASTEGDLFRFENYIYCPAGTQQTLLKQGKIQPPPPRELYTGEGTAIVIIAQMIALYARVGTWLVWFGAQIVAPLLSLSSFITHPMVTAGWPFVLGFANLGFIIALLFIAFATTLQIESMGARRMLPRLLLGAILINFSLIIAGVILDLSRLLMAVMVSSLMPDNNTATLSNLGANLLLSSPLLSKTFDFSTLAWVGVRAEATHWGVVFDVLRGTLLIWFIATGFVILVAGLFIRYIALILLLIVSPFAYLALAFPNTGSYAITWWRLFLKYVFYGPIALFILILVVRINDTGGQVASLGFLDYTVKGIASIIITGVMFVAAAMAGSKFGIISASAVVASANKFRKTNLAARALTGSHRLAADYIGRRTGFQPIKGTQDFFAGRAAALERADRLRKKGSGGTRFAKQVYGGVGITNEERQQIAALRRAGIAANPLTDPAFSPKRLRSEAVGSALSREQISTIIQAVPANTAEKKTKDDMIAAMVKNKEIVQNMDSTQINQIEQYLESQVAQATPALPIPPTPSPLSTTATPQQIAMAQQEYNRKLAEHQQIVTTQNTSQQKNQQKFSTTLQNLHDTLRNIGNPSDKK